MARIWEIWKRNCWEAWRRPNESTWCVHLIKGIQRALPYLWYLLAQFRGRRCQVFGWFTQPSFDSFRCFFFRLFSPRLELLIPCTKQARSASNNAGTPKPATVGSPAAPLCAIQIIQSVVPSQVKWNEMNRPKNGFVLTWVRPQNSATIWKGNREWSMRWNVVPNFETESKWVSARQRGGIEMDGDCLRKENDQRSWSVSGNAFCWSKKSFPVECFVNVRCSVSGDFWCYTTTGWTPNKLHCSVKKPVGSVEMTFVIDRLDQQLSGDIKWSLASDHVKSSIYDLWRWDWSQAPRVHTFTRPCLLLGLLIKILPHQASPASNNEWIIN